MYTNCETLTTPRIPLGSPWYQLVYVTSLLSTQRNVPSLCFTSPIQGLKFMSLSKVVTNAEKKWKHSIYNVK